MIYTGDWPPPLEPITHDTRGYRNGEFETGAGLHHLCDDVRVKLATSRGETKWLTITYAEAIAIADLLTRTED